MDKQPNIAKVSADIFLLLGSNMGNRMENINKSKILLKRKGIKIISESSFYETAPWGNTDQDNFLNKSLKVETDLLPEQLLGTLKFIEIEMGRVILEKWGPRIIDIDILLFGKEIIVKKDLKIPHAELHNRKFALLPLNEIAENYNHPVLNLSISALLKNCQDASWVKRLADDQTTIKG